MHAGVSLEKSRRSRLKHRELPTMLAADPSVPRVSLAVSPQKHGHPNRKLSALSNLPAQNPFGQFGTKDVKHT